MYSLMKAYLSRVSIPSVFGASNSETSKAFNIHRPASAAVRSRLCLPHISHACQSKFDLRASCHVGITKNTGGNPGDSPRPVAVNKSGGTKSDICGGNEAQVRKVDSDSPRRIEIIPPWVRNVLS